MGDFTEAFYRFLVGLYPIKPDVSRGPPGLSRGSGPLGTPNHCCGLVIKKLLNDARQEFADKCVTNAINQSINQSINHVRLIMQ